MCWVESFHSLRVLWKRDKRRNKMPTQLVSWKNGLGLKSENFTNWMIFNDPVLEDSTSLGILISLEVILFVWHCNKNCYKMTTQAKWSWTPFVPQGASARRGLEQQEQSARHKSRSWIFSLMDFIHKYNEINSHKQVTHLQKEGFSLENKETEMTTTWNPKHIFFHSIICSHYGQCLEAFNRDGVFPRCVLHKLCRWFIRAASELDINAEDSFRPFPMP